MYKFLLLYVILMFFGCINNISSQKTKYLEGKYSGEWARTNWSYTFTSDETFLFECSGHFGTKKTEGHYLIREDTLFLNSDSTVSAENYFFANDAFIILGDSCIIDVKMKHKYCK